MSQLHSNQKRILHVVIPDIQKGKRDAGKNTRPITLFPEGQNEEIGLREALVGTMI
jgi:hypothetical protein